MSKRLSSFISNYILYFAFIQALAATLGSLYFSEIRHWAPCVLCWYQRIFMYPLTFILAIGIARKDKDLPYYVLPLSIVGMAFALYHYLLQVGVISESIAPCVAGVSCLQRYDTWFGFVTIPFLSLLAFAFITVCMVVFKKYGKRN